MHIEQLTDFPGSEVDAAISANGEYVAFLSDRDSVYDAFVTRVGSGRFTNLTRGRFEEAGTQLIERHPAAHLFGRAEKVHRGLHLKHQQTRCGGRSRGGTGFG